MVNISKRTIKLCCARQTTNQNLNLITKSYNMSSTEQAKKFINKSSPKQDKSINLA